MPVADEVVRQTLGALDLAGVLASALVGGALARSERLDPVGFVVGGSAVRDVVVQRIPGIFGGRTLYATSALAGSGVLVVLHVLGLPTAGLVAGTAVGAALTLVADRRGWQLREAYHLRPAALLVRPRRRRR